MQIKTNKIIAVMIVLVMLYASFGTVISYAADAIIDATKMEQQNTKTNVENVSFDVYYGDGRHSKEIDVQGTEKLYVKIDVKDGILTNPVIRLSDSNLKITAVEPEVSLKDNVITLDQITGNKELTLTVVPDIKDTVSSDFFEKQNSFEITGTYVNQNNKETAVNGSIKVNTFISAKKEESGKDVKNTIEQQITKVIPYSTSSKSGVLVEATVLTGLENYIIPVKTETLTFTAPMISGSYPETVKVVGRTTLNNGSYDSKVIESTYNNQDGKVTVTVNNNEDSISWIKDSVNEYKFLCSYPASAYDEVKGKSVYLEISSASKMKYYEYANGNESSRSTTHGSMYSNSGSLVDVKTSISGPISKGYMYNNINASDEDDKETPYSTKYEVYVAGAIEDQIDVKLNDDKFIAGDNSYDSKSIIKSLKINKENIKEILGEEGTIKVVSENTVIKTLNKDSEEVSLEDYNLNTITLRISAPAKEGTLAIDVQRKIGKDSKDQLESFSSIKTSTEGTFKIGEDTVEINNIKEGTAELTEPEAKAKVSIRNTVDNNSTNISTVITSRVAIEALLETDSVDDKLYNNPTIEITIPEEYLSDLKVVSSELTHGEQVGLSLESVEQNGNKIIAKINGTQTKYSNDEVVGPRLIVLADITPDAVAPSKEEIVTMEVKGVTTVETKYNYVAEPGLVKINTVKVDSEEIISIQSDGEMILPIEKEQVAEVTGRIINNEDKDASNVKVLIRVPVVNAEVEEGEETNQFEAYLANAVTAEGCTVYYSTIEDATNEIEKEGNDWKIETEDFSTVRSILIVKDETLAKHNDFRFTYNLSIPALKYNKENVVGYLVSYNEESETGSIPTTTKSHEIKLTTGQGPSIDVALFNVPETVAQGQLIDARTIVTNNGTKTVNNVVVTLQVPEGMKLLKYNPGNAEYDEPENMELDLEDPETIDVGPINDFTFEKLDQGESVSLRFIIRVNKDAEEDEAEIKITAKSDEITSEGKVTTTIKEGSLTVVNRETVGEYFNTAKEGEVKEFVIEVFNNTDKDIKDVNVEYKISSDAIILSAGVVEDDLSEVNDIEKGFTVDENNNLIYRDGTVKANDLLRIKVMVKIGEDSIFSKAKVTAKDIDELYSNQLDIEVLPVRFDVKIVSEDNQQVKEGTEAIYEYEIKNKSDFDIKENTFYLTLDDSIKFEKAEITFKNGEKSEEVTLLNEDELYTFTRFKSGETINIKVYTKALELSAEDIKEGDKQAKATLKYVFNNYKEMNLSLTYYIIYNKDIHEEGYLDPVDDPNYEEPTEEPAEEEITHKISGTVWFDENKNGQRDSSEITLTDLKVILLNASDASIVKDKDTKEYKITEVAKDGTYSFSNLRNGNYIVAFLYEDEAYIVTTYHSEGATESVNSDVIAKTILYEGKQYQGGLTDTITIFNANRRDIDLGLVKADKFGLTLTKKISKVSVTTNGETKTYDYSDSTKQISKIEVKDKDLNNTSVIVEYKISVTNNGNVAGYAKKIVDYLPKEMKFNSELNPNWYLGTDGNAYNNELANTEIKPGETKEISIVLTKIMTSENTGVFANSAAITETYNIEGLDNKGDNNTGSTSDKTANIAITTKTGQPAMYIGLTLVVISIMGFGAYEINKHVINAEERG